MLEEERVRLTAELEEMELASAENQSEVSGENNYRDHMADQGSATFAREMDVTLADSLRTTLGDLERALERMAEGSYGTCTRCGADIPRSRLEAVPAAELCIACKEWEESS
jgi:DnaK suppressor protein